MHRKVTFFVLFSLLTLLLFAGQAAAEEDLKIGFIYNGPATDAGWSYAHDLGRAHLAEEYPEAEVVYIESVPEGSESVSSIESLARNDFDVIFTTSFGYMEQTLQVAEKYPDTVFMHCSGYKTAENMGNYFGRIYQARYLTGIVAGQMTEVDEIGFVGAHPIPEVIRGINAFALGVKSVNPDATVNVIWTNSWYDPAGEKEAALSLIDTGVDVVAQHQNTPGPQQAAEEEGVYGVGYNQDMSEYAPDAHLTAPVWNWGVIYESIVQDVIDGTWEPAEIWWGLEKGAVDIAPLGPMVPEEVEEEVMAAKEAIINGELEVFAGPIKNQEGEVVVEDGQSMTDDEIWGMNFFVDNVKGKLPED